MISSEVMIFVPNSHRFDALRRHSNRNPKEPKLKHFKHRTEEYKTPRSNQMAPSNYISS